ncbi:MAG: CBS domain-containing protein [Deltaproteobacteria bacterium]|jgi:CBS domain-containing protein|nr:CBS domain-containing protein [Deltaproteobacteria bacterium]
MYARDIMSHRFHTLSPSNTIAEAVSMFHIASMEEGKRIFGLMVIDEKDRLVGMLSMYDILLFVQPKHVHVWSEIEDLEAQSLFGELLDRVKSVQVADIMTTNVVTVKPHTHVMAIADLMIKRHIRRVPVVEGNDLVGIVYISDLFYHLLQKFL